MNDNNKKEEYIAETRCEENLYSLAKSDKLPHAIIIEHEDIEKSYSVAFQTIALALCHKENKPCGVCSHCIKIKSDSHPDVKTISAQGSVKSVKIEDIRFIREDAYVISNEGSYKFYIIKDADYMTSQAQNALIKILEEPPKGVTFILLCKSVSSLLKTVISRSQVFKMNRNLSDKDFVEILELAKKIAYESSSHNSYEVMKYIATVPNDRKLLKELTENIIENLLKIYADSQGNEITSEELICKIDELKTVVDLSDKNINFNLLTCFLSACL